MEEPLNSKVLSPIAHLSCRPSGRKQRLCRWHHHRRHRSHAAPLCRSDPASREEKENPSGTCGETVLFLQLHSEATSTPRQAQECTRCKNELRRETGNSSTTTNIMLVYVCHGLKTKTEPAGSTGWAGAPRSRRGPRWTLWAQRPDQSASARPTCDGRPNGKRSQTTNEIWEVCQRPWRATQPCFWFSQKWEETSLQLDVSVIGSPKVRRNHQLREKVWELFNCGGGGIGLVPHVQRFLSIPCPLGECGKSGVVALLTNKTERN